MRTEEGPARVPGTESSGARTRARRQLLRGTFAVPTVLTLSSGSALARSSSLRCFANSPHVVDANPTGTTVWRVQRYKRMVIVNGVATLATAVIDGDDVRAFASGGSVDVTAFESGKYYFVDGSGSLPDGDPALGTLTADGYLSLRLVYTGGGFKVVGVGDVPFVTVPSDPQVPGTHVMWGSCWTSFAVPPGG